jgi:HEAT repeat protein
MNGPTWTTMIGVAVLMPALWVSAPSVADTPSGSVEELLDTLNTSDALTQPDVVRAIEEMGENAVPPLIEAMNQGNTRLRHQAIEILGRIGNDAHTATPHLIEALTDSEAQIRRNAAWALGRVGEEANDSIPSLLTTARDHQWDVRADAVWAMGKVVEDNGEWGPIDGELVDAVIDFLGDESHHVRWSAAWSLARFGPSAEAAVEALAKALEDYHPKVRASAAAALGEIAASHHEDLIGDALIKAMDDESHLVRARAGEALRALRSRTVPGM